MQPKVFNPRDAQQTLLRLLLACAVLLVIFALYAPSVRLMLFHDDAVILPGIVDRTILNVFEKRPNDTVYRPMSYVPWLLIRDWFGWFVPGIVHMWNVFAHVLNVALVMALAQWLGRRVAFGGVVFGLVAGLAFGLFPFSYQAVLWGSALVHPLMGAFGLMAVYAYLRALDNTRRRAVWAVVAAVSLMAAGLSHETGVLFGAFLILAELYDCVATRRRPQALPIGISAVAGLYALVYILLLRTPSASSAGIFTPPLTSAGPNFLFFAQGMVSWILILTRSFVGLTDTRNVVLIVLFGASTVGALLLLWKSRLIALGLFSLSWWALALVPAVALLTEAYVTFGPRLLYVSSIGVALFWAAVTAAIVYRLRRPVLQVVFMAPIAVLCAWCIPYVADRMNETARLTPALRMIDGDLRESAPTARVLLVNLPWWNAPTYPAFLIGAEGMPIFQHEGAPAWTWLATVSGTRRDMTYVRHELSLTHNDRFDYGVPGVTVGDAQLRAQLLKASYSYRFDYDSPGLRARRLAIVGTDRTTARPLAKLTLGQAQAAIRDARVSQCGSEVILDIAWSDVRNMQGPTGVFVHLIDEEGRQGVVADKDLIDGYMPLDQVPPDVVITETREITVPSTVAPLKQAEIGAYLRSDGHRLIASRADGGPWDGDAVIVPIEAGVSDLCDQVSH